MPAALTEVLDLVAAAGDDAVGTAAALGMAEAALARAERRMRGLPPAEHTAAGRGRFRISPPDAQMATPFGRVRTS